MSQTFPEVIIIDLGFPRSEFNQYFTVPPSVEDFHEIVSQLVFCLMNHPYEVVMQNVGVDFFPDVSRLADRRIGVDSSIENQYTLATANLTSHFIGYFTALDFINDAREFPYSPKNFFGDLMTLTYTPD